MRVLDLRLGHEEEDRQWGRYVIQTEVAHPSKTVMLIRGDSPEVAHLADRAATRSNGLGWREVIWVRDHSLFPDDTELRWFGYEDRYAAVVLDFNDAPAARLDMSATLYDIEQAFLAAQQGGG